MLELLDRVLNTGVVLAGDVTITVADIELIYLRLQLMLSSAETARQAGWLAVGPHWDRDRGDVAMLHDREADAGDRPAVTERHDRGCSVAARSRLATVAARPRLPARTSGSIPRTSATD